MWRGRFNTPFVTPETDPPGVISRRVSIPADIGFLQLVNGVLSALLDPENFTQTQGGLTPEETAQRFQQMYTDYVNGEDIPTMGIVPIGSIVAHLRTTALPSGWLECDGAQYAAEDYPELFAALPATLKQLTTFNVPDLRLRVPVGIGAAGHAYNSSLGAAGGAATVTLNVNQIPQHTHALGNISIPQHSAKVPIRSSSAGWAGGGGTIHMHAQTTVTGEIDAEIPGMIIAPPSVSPAGSGLAHDNIQPFIATLWAIRAE